MAGLADAPLSRVVEMHLTRNPASPSEAILRNNLEVSHIFVIEILARPRDRELSSSTIDLLSTPCEYA